MKRKIIETLKTIKQSKRMLYLVSTSVLILFCLVLNVTFSAFTSSTKNIVANIKVGDLEYSLNINGNPGTIITVPANEISKFNIGLVSLNEIDTKYELTYVICSDETCATTVEQSEYLLVDYSSRTIDNVNGEINPSGQKLIRIVTTNTSSNTYYVKLLVNAGYSHNVLTLEDKMGEYLEDDVVIAAYIYGELSTTFPTTTDYGVEVECHQADGSASNANGKAIWNGEKWIVTVENVDTGETRCNVYFGDKIDNTLPELIITSPTSLLSTTSSSPLYIDTNTITITGTATDESGIGVLTINSTKVTVSDDGTWTADITIGANSTTTITIVVIDSAGNKVTETYYISYDNNLPELKITSPAGTTASSPKYINTDIITVNATASDISGIKSVTVNDTAAAIRSDGTWSASLKLTEGAISIITVVATDNLGNTATEPCFVYVDKTSPTLEITSPTGTTSSSPKYVYTSSISISGTAADNIGIESVTVNGTKVTVGSNGSWTASITLTKDKTTTITIIATDKAGNTTIQTCYVMYETVRYLYSAGNTHDSITGGWILNPSYHGTAPNGHGFGEPTITYNADNMYIYRYGGNGSSAIYPANKMDLTPYKTLTATFTPTNYRGDCGDGFAVWDSSTKSPARKHKFTNAGKQATVTLDVSELGNGYYIGFLISTANESYIKLNIYEVKLTI